MMEEDLRIRSMQIEKKAAMMSTSVSDLFPLVNML